MIVKMIWHVLQKVVTLLGKTNGSTFIDGKIDLENFTYHYLLIRFIIILQIGLCLMNYNVS